MKIKFKFHGPNVVSIVTREESIKIGHAISFVVETIAETPSLEEIRHFWEMERAFNELTKGRLHIELAE